MSVVSDRYNSITIFLHWLSAIIIIWVTISGSFVSLFSVDLEIKNSIIRINVLLTTLLIPVFLYRVINRIFNPAPCYSERVSERSRKLAKLAHFSMYCLILIVLTSGALMMDRDVKIFDVVLICQTVYEPSWRKIFTSLHVYSISILTVLIVAHIFAVFKHESSGAKLLKRMLW
jgi:cytochrome b561